MGCLGPLGAWEWRGGCWESGLWEGGVEMVRRGGGAGWKVT